MNVDVSISNENWTIIAVPFKYKGGMFVSFICYIMSPQKFFFKILSKLDSFLYAFDKFTSSVKILALYICIIYHLQFCLVNLLYGNYLFWNFAVSINLIRLDSWKVRKFAVWQRWDCSSKTYKIYSQHVYCVCSWTGKSNLIYILCKKSWI